MWSMTSPSPSQVEKMREISQSHVEDETGTPEHVSRTTRYYVHLLP